MRAPATGILPCLLLVVALACTRPGALPTLLPPPGKVVFSLLAVGDTGERPPLSARLHQQREVGRGLAVEDARQPADALVLLGDNFYPDGLREHELGERLRDNLVGPFCHFVDLSGPRSAEVADACDLPAPERRPIPILALLGNHDYGHPESPRLQREVVRGFVPNWHATRGVATCVEFEGGVSLVLADSELLLLSDGALELARVLRGSRGPWRILAVHRPLARTRDFHGARGQAAYGAYRDLLLRALETSGVAVQAVLSGHAHNLQLLALDLPAPALQVVAGSGSEVRALANSSPALRFGLAAPGFARLDLVRGREGERLVVSLFATDEQPLLSDGQPRLVASHTLDASGRTTREVAGIGASPGSARAR